MKTKLKKLKCQCPMCGRPNKDNYACMECTKEALRLLRSE